MTGTGRDCLSHAAAALLLLLLLLGIFPASDAASTLSATPGTAAVSTCQSRTVNYITHTLPQQCLKTGWAGASILEESVVNSEVAVSETLGPQSASEAARQDSAVNLHPTNEVTVVTATTLTPVHEITTATEPPSTASSQTTSATDTIEDIDRETEALLDEANFLSFEEWKKQNLERAGQSDENIGERRRVHEEHRRRPEGIDNVLDSLGEDSEIELDFWGFGSGGSGTTEASLRSTTTRSRGHTARTDTPETEDGVQGAIRSRSKDVGKTSPERFNYASFDCAATVLKTNRECKGSSSILVENKDSYMLNECTASNKFFIVELCNEILVDTVVLANFEFFSSMFRSFRVSVSDLYPTTADRLWKELGVFEARNSREVQAFLVQNPLIFARYLRVEFLTHYGNEFYCPVSLLRVHGTTMMEDFREDARRVEELVLEAVPELEGTTQNLATDEGATPETQSSDSVSVQEPPDEKSGEQPSSASNESSEVEDKSYGTETKSADERDTPSCGQPLSAEFEALFLPFNLSGLLECKLDDDTESGQTGISHIRADVIGPEPSGEDTPISSTSAAIQMARSSSAKDPASISGQPTQASKSFTTVRDATPPTTAEASSKVSNHTSQNVQHHQVSTTSPPPANPTTQESFFKTIHKRLQLLEANATLSLQYIEEQSRMLRDAFVKVEKRQLARTSNFLENLNATVLNELRVLRQMYDLLWQSTVIELETQREQSQREIVAISSRLSILADEVIFQKRMSIVQSLLLLLCLGLVLFSRYPATASYLELPLLQSMLARSQTTLSSPYESPPGSPRSAPCTRPSSARQSDRKSRSSHSRQPSDESTNSLRSPTPEFSPPTPSSGAIYSGNGDGIDGRRRAGSSPPSVSSGHPKGHRGVPHSSASTSGWTQDPSGRRTPIAWPGTGHRKENEELLSPERTPERKRGGTVGKFSSPKHRGMHEDGERFHHEGEEEIDRDRHGSDEEDDDRYDDTRITDEFTRGPIGDESNRRRSNTQRSRLLSPSPEESPSP